MFKRRPLTIPSETLFDSDSQLDPHNSQAYSALTQSDHEISSRQTISNNQTTQPTASYISAVRSEITAPASRSSEWDVPTASNTVQSNTGIGWSSPTNRSTWKDYTMGGTIEESKKTFDSLALKDSEVTSEMTVLDAISRY